MSREDETIRWPTNLDRKAIERRLAEVRKAAQSSKLADLAALLANVEGMAAAQIGASVVAALDLLQKQPEHEAIAKQLQMVALNLKNLK